MMSSVKAILIPAFLALFFLTSGQPEAGADSKKYAFNREYKTLPKGAFEIESWTKLKVPDQNRSNVNEWTFEQELEYGITDHLTIANYQVWQTKNKKGKDDSTTYKGFKFETKYRIGDPGKFWIDPLIYVEWVTDVRRKKNPNKIESKIILSKDFGPVNVVYNQIMENRLGSGGRTEHAYTYGASYALPWGISVGLEGKGTYKLPSTNKNKISLGPVVAWENRYFFVTAGTVFGLNREANDVEARFIVGVPFEIW